VIEDRDHLDEQDDASILFFGSWQRKRIARRCCGASVKGRRTQSTTLFVMGARLDMV
jgi:hypothetical protein